MKKLIICVLIEWKKLFKSKLPLFSLLALSLVPFIGGFFMYVLQDPELARSTGFISDQAQLFGGEEADWIAFLSLLSQAISIGGLIVFGFVTSWVFGREYSDRTIKDLLALPISRTLIVVSKFIVIGLWSLILTVFILMTGLLIGYFLRLDEGTANSIGQGIFIYISCSILTVLLSTPIAWFASLSRGYMLPMGFAIFTVVISQLVTVIGYGEFFPWAIPALASGITGNSILNYISLLIVFFVSILGCLATISNWKYSDQN